jgi:hypothetical protein
MECPKTIIAVSAKFLHGHFIVKYYLTLQIYMKFWLCYKVCSLNKAGYILNPQTLFRNTNRKAVALFFIFQAITNFINSPILK